MINLSQLTLQEKLRLICGKGCWKTEDLEGKLPQVIFSDGPMGVRKVAESKNGAEVTVPSVAYPSVQVLANTWSEECARLMGASIADDCISLDVDVLLGPGVNIKRSPFCGRNFELFSEDPYLAGMLARAYISAMQEGGVGACVKHFCANNLEFDRTHQSSDVDERTLREIYYKPFEIACEAKPLTLMCSYNRVNGKYAAEYKKGFDMLRSEFGFDGAILSDWGAVRDRAASARAGLDLEMPFSEINFKKLEEDVASGIISEEEIDACVQRILELISRCGKMRETRRVRSDESDRVLASKRIAAEGAVLLKNNGVLPLKKGIRLSVCGCYARPDTVDMIRGEGSSAVNRKEWHFDLPAALQARTGGEVVYEGAFRYDGVESGTQNFLTAKSNAALSDVNIVCVGTGGKYEYEAGDRQTLRLPAVQELAIRETASANPNTVVVIFAGAAIDTSAWADCVAAILFAGYNGDGGDEVVADLLTGERNPCGKLSETFPLESDLPELSRTAGVTRYAEGLDVGYRFFMSRRKPVCYPFGFGLSYSEFVYSDLVLDYSGDNLRVAYKISNHSQRDGKEISQVYVRPITSYVYRPERELKAFSKDEIGAGKTVNVGIRLDLKAFAYWSAACDDWTVDDGVYEICIGASVSDIRLKGTVCVSNGKIIIPSQKKM